MRSNRGQCLVAALGTVLPVGAWLAFGSLVPACGGTKGASASLPEAAAPEDPGSGPVNCSQSDLYEFRSIEDFEYGAATGWYTNNEVCYPWTQAAAECADAGFVCYPGSQATPACQGPKAPVGVWSSCYGAGPVDCSDVDAALAACAAECSSLQPSPPFLADQLPAAPIQPVPRCGSSYAMHVKGGPFRNWGGNVGTRFAVPFDASNYDGVALWMRGAPAFARNVRIAIGDRYTDSQLNMYPVDGGAQYCDPNPNCQVQTSQGNANCYNVGCDKFGAYTPLDDNWHLFLASFGDMRQGGWGKQRPSLDLTGIVSIEVDYPQGSWDFWIDDISFYRRQAQ